MFGSEFDKDINDAEKALAGYLDKLEKTGKLPAFASKKKLAIDFLEGFETGWNFRSKSPKDFRVNEGCKIIKEGWNGTSQLKNFGVILGYIMESLRKRYSSERNGEFNMYLDALRSGPFFKMVRIAIEEAESHQHA